jgi:two-component system, sensor histidine kinase YesM
VLQQQINPHFLYNTLDSINWMASEKGNENISVMIKALGFMLRGSVNDNDLIYLEKEIEFVNCYIAIQKIRFEERLDFTLDIDKSFNSIQIPKITLQPIVENSINHSLERFSSVCSIKVTAQYHEEYAAVIIQDNGPGMDEDFLDKLHKGLVKPTRTGIGLKNIDERIKILFGENYGITITSIVGTGTKVVIRLPV